MIQSSGTAECTSTLPTEASNSGTQTVTSTLTQINDINIDNSHDYLEFADPMVTVTGNGTPQRVTVTCLLESVHGTETRSVTLDTGTSTAPSSASMALVNAASPGETAVACSRTSSATPAAIVTVTSSLYALETAD